MVLEHTLGAFADEEGSLTDKVLWDISEFLESLRHGDGEMRRDERGGMERESREGG